MENLKARENHDKEIKEEVRRKLTFVSEEVLNLSEETEASVKQLIENGQYIKTQISTRAEQLLRSKTLPEGGRIVCRLTEKIQNLVIFMKDVDESVLRVKDVFKQARKNRS
ncbi:hypothetical protein IOC57_07885 [Bacillus sp. SD075]|uniref:hypothetical protein n=1 Tax=Bacillus sp. SD075 TaxID=2781732 RepID=UPI001A95AACA|nr:hypothetical protein [Bacillus sp. SD075]MBO0997664.1 hypothetical protein [Bacillus sp. SD075]